MPAAGQERELVRQKSSLSRGSEAVAGYRRYRGQEVAAAAGVEVAHCCQQLGEEGGLRGHSMTGEEAVVVRWTTGAEELEEELAVRRRWAEAGPGVRSRSVKEVVMAGLRLWLGVKVDASSRVEGEARLTLELWEVAEEVKPVRMLG